MKKIKIMKASDYNYKEMREISTLEDLEQIAREFNDSIVIRFLDKNEKKAEQYDISAIIYDDYLE